MDTFEEGNEKNWETRREYNQTKKGLMMIPSWDEKLFTPLKAAKVQLLWKERERKRDAER